MSKSGDRMFTKQRVGVESDDHVALGLSPTAVESCCFSAIFLTENMEALVRAAAHRLVISVVAGTVVDHNDLEIRVVRCEQTLNRPADDLFFVKGRNDDRNHRLITLAKMGSFAAARPYVLSKGEQTDHNHSANAKNDADQEYPLHQPAADRNAIKDVRISFRVIRLVLRDRRHRVIKRDVGEIRNRG